MPQLFRRSHDTVFRALVVGGLGCAVVMLGLMLAVARSAYITGKNITLEQPAPFSHQHHVSDIGIDCRYCHRGVEQSASAGIPTTQICMNCHRQLWNQSDMLEPVRKSYEDDIPLAWNRVHDLPDYVYFNHSIHVAKGIGCYECHGRISEMPLVRQAHALTMGWCLDCHRDPIQHVRPARFVFMPKPLAQLIPEDGDIVQLQSTLAKSYKLQRRTDCYTCHR